MAKDDKDKERRLRAAMDAIATQNLGDVQLPRRQPPPPPAQPPEVPQRIVQRPDQPGLSDASTPEYVALGAAGALAADKGLRRNTAPNPRHTTVAQAKKVAAGAGTKPAAQADPETRRPPRGARRSNVSKPPANPKIGEVDLKTAGAKEGMSRKQRRIVNRALRSTKKHVVSKVGNAVLKKAGLPISVGLAGRAAYNQYQDSQANTPEELGLNYPEQTDETYAQAQASLDTAREQRSKDTSIPYLRQGAQDVADAFPYRYTNFFQADRNKNLAMTDDVRRIDDLRDRQALDAGAATGDESASAEQQVRLRNAVDAGVPETIGAVAATGYEGLRDDARDIKDLAVDTGKGLFGAGMSLADRFYQGATNTSPTAEQVPTTDTDTTDTGTTTPTGLPSALSKFAAADTSGFQGTPVAPTPRGLRRGPQVIGPNGVEQQLTPFERPEQRQPSIFDPVGVDVIRGTRQQFETFPGNRQTHFINGQKRSGNAVLDDMFERNLGATRERNAAIDRNAAMGLPPDPALIDKGAGVASSLLAEAVEAGPNATGRNKHLQDNMVLINNLLPEDQAVISEDFGGMMYEERGAENAMMAKEIYDDYNANIGWFSKFFGQKPIPLGSPEQSARSMIALGAAFSAGDKEISGNMKYYPYAKDPAHPTAEEKTKPTYLDVDDMSNALISKLTGYFERFTRDTLATSARTRAEAQNNRIGGGLGQAVYNAGY